MSDIVVPGFKSSELIAQLDKVFSNYSAEEKAKLIKEVNGIFLFVIQNDEKKEVLYTIDCKTEGSVIRGKGKSKPDAIINIGDKDFVDLSQGKLNGQKAYMTGKLKVKGQITLAMKLDNVFKTINPTAKL
ncbi:SCP2 sterol-binding domain-containing protein [Chlamydoabsidia padenii]|nr:SCP2 sterol-binding domain-containing protein [Chlamydoabsidia padenii]